MHFEGNLYLGKRQKNERKHAKGSYRAVGSASLAPRRWTEVAHYISAPFSQAPAPGGCSAPTFLPWQGQAAQPGALLLWAASCSPNRGWCHKETLLPMCSPRAALPSKALCLSGRAGVNDFCISLRAQPSWLVKEQPLDTAGKCSLSIVQLPVLRAPGVGVISPSPLPPPCEELPSGI